jgi:hypothetical protein
MVFFGQKVYSAPFSVVTYPASRDIRENGVISVKSFSSLLPLVTHLLSANFSDTLGITSWHKIVSTKKGQR